MRNGITICVLHAVLVLAVVFEAHSAPVVINQVLKGPVFGAPHSNDVPKRIVVAEDGFLYVTGTTFPSTEGDAPWGEVQTEEVTGKQDVFISKFSSSGQLLWVKRTGSAENDTVNDLKVTKEGIYICGSTDGRLGFPSQGSSDAYIMKFHLDGSKSWRHPFQFGTRGYDSCHSLHIGSGNGTVFATGNTGGQMFNNATLSKDQLQYFVARFKELRHNPIGLQLVKGRQQGSYGSCSGDGVVLVRNLLFVMSSNWDQHWDKKRTETYLNILDPFSLTRKKLHVLKTEDEAGFYGVRMAALDEKGEVYIIGISSESLTSYSYRVLKFSLSANQGQGGLEWVTQVGSVSAKAHMVNQIPSIAIDPSKQMVYVAGIEDGFFANATDGSSGLVSVPFRKLDMNDGHINQTWQRITTVPFEKEELTDIALRPGRPVMYTGVWDGGSEYHLNVMIGSFGTERFASRSTRSKPVEVGPNALSAAIDNENKKLGGGKIAAYVLLSLGGAGIVCSALFATRAAQKREKVARDELSNVSEMEQVRKQVAESHREDGFSQTEPKDVAIGGSADPH